jgi:hypothetical protein
MVEKPKKMLRKLRVVYMFRATGAPAAKELAYRLANKLGS